MQIASYTPIVNIKVSSDTGEFAAFIAAIVTFDIPDVDMESVLPFLAFKEDEIYLEDLNEEVLTDLTQIKDVLWLELKYLYMQTSSFDSATFF